MIFINEQETNEPDPVKVVLGIKNNRIGRHYVLQQARR